MFALEGGLDAWKDAGFQALPVDHDDQPCVPCEGGELAAAAAESPAASPGAPHAHAFLPGLVENYANRRELPLKRRLAVLFVDIADSTEKIAGREPEEALAFVQRFMEHVTRAALDCCGCAEFG